jgi:hypothetical protein
MAKRFGWGFLVALGAVTPLLFGCAGGPDYAAVNHQATTISEQCETQFQSGLIKTRFAVEHCKALATEQLYLQNGVPDMDVAEAYYAARERIATQFDEGKISKETMAALLDEARERAQAETDRRNAIRRANAQAGIAAALGQLGNSMQGAGQQPDPWGTNNLTPEQEQERYIECSQSRQGPEPQEIPGQPFTAQITPVDPGCE